MILPGVGIAGDPRTGEPAGAPRTGGASSARAGTAPQAGDQDGPHGSGTGRQSVRILRARGELALLFVNTNRIKAAYGRAERFERRRALLE